MTEHDGPTIGDDEQYFRQHSIKYANSRDTLPEQISWEQTSYFLTAQRFLEPDEQTGITPYQFLSETYGEAFYVVPAESALHTETRNVKFFTAYGDKNARQEVYAKVAAENAIVIAQEVKALALMLQTFDSLQNGGIAASAEHVPGNMICVSQAADFDSTVDIIERLIEQGKGWRVVPLYDDEIKISDKEVSLWAEPDSDDNDPAQNQIGRHTSNGAWLRVIKDV